MNTLKKKPILRLLSLVLVFCLLSVEGWAREERMYMRNGHEGDPTDGNDIVSGGRRSIDHDENIPNDSVLFDDVIFHVGEYCVQIYPKIRGGQIIWTFTIIGSRGDFK